MTFSPSDLLNSLRWRYAVKSFQPGALVSPDRIEALMESLVLAPSSYGLQPYVFVDVQSTAVRSELRNASWDQSQVTDAQRFVVFAIRTSMGTDWVDAFLRRVAEVRGVEVSNLEGYRKAIIGDLVEGPRAAKIDDWAARQAYIALGTLLTAAAVLEVDATPMEGLDPAAYDRILDLPSRGLRTVCACALGLRSPEDLYAAATKVRFPRETLFLSI